jgi:hypothetical protein
MGRALVGLLIKLSYFAEGYERADWKQQGSADWIGKGENHLHSIRKSSDFCLEEKAAETVSVYKQKRLTDLSSPGVKSADMGRNVKGTVLQG